MTERQTDETDQSEKGVYAGSNERDWGEQYGWFFSPDSQRVYNPQDGAPGPLIITADGEVEERYIRRAQRKVGQGTGMLWGRLAPVEIGSIEIRRDTKIWHDEREDWLVADRIELIEEPEPEPRLTFIVQGAWPRTRLSYPASRLKELREDGVIESQKEVNDQAEAALEEFRQKQGEQ